jgi:hypothetical protein
MGGGISVLVCVSCPNNQMMDIRSALRSIIAELIESSPQLYKGQPVSVRSFDTVKVLHNFALTPFCAVESEIFTISEVAVDCLAFNEG